MTTQGDRLKDIRLALKLKQQEFAEKLGLKSQAISKVESNIGNFSVDIYEKLAIDFNINLNYLIAGKGEMFLDGNNIPTSPATEKLVVDITKKILSELGISTNQ